MKSYPYIVIETPCYPCSFQVFDPKSSHNNDTRNFFRTRKEAQTEADKRNKSYEEYVAAKMAGELD